MAGGALTVFRKEWLDAWRDRRALLSALVFPLFMPALLGFGSTMLASNAGRLGAHEVAVTGGEAARELSAALRKQGLAVVPLDGGRPEAERAVTLDAISVALVVPEALPADLARGEPAAVEVVYDSASREVGALLALRTALARYGAELGGLRLLARGVDPGLVAPLMATEVDVATSERKAASFLLVVPMFLIMAAFLGGMHVAIDATAGERERGSLEPLLVNPVSRLAIAAGKWGVAAVFAALSAVITAAGTVVALDLAPLSALGLRFSPSWFTCLALLAGIVPLALMSSALQLLVASRARSFREAQTYVALLMMVPMLPSLWLSVSPVELATWQYTIPVLAQIQLLADALAGVPLRVEALLFSTITSLVVAALAVLGTARSFFNETIIRQG